MNISLRITRVTLVNLGYLVANKTIPGLPPDERFIPSPPPLPVKSQQKEPIAKRYPSSSFVKIIKLKKHREAARLSHKELAEKAHLSASVISNIERGKTKSVTVRTAVKLANALGINYTELTKEVNV